MQSLKECPACNSKQVLFFFRKDDCDFLECKDCKLIFQNPLPTVERLATDFLTQKARWHLRLNKDLIKIKRPRKDFVKIINTLINMGSNGNLLDVGCSNGELMFLAKEKGFDVYGVEINKDSAKIAADNGLDVFVGKLQTANFPSDYFSVICLMGVIEDIPDPALLLQECWRILKKDGIMVITTLNTDCFWVKATKKLNAWFEFPWSVIIPYYRIFIFSDANLKDLLLRSKFNVKNIEYSSVSLRHELGAVRWLLKSNKKKSIGNACYLLLVFFTYSFVYFINLLTSPFLSKDFIVIFFAQKGAD